MGKRSREKRERLALRGQVKLGEGGMERKFHPGRKSHLGLEKVCLFVIRWGTYLVLFTPLLISTKFFFPFVAPKTTFFRIVVEVIFAAYLFLLASNPSRYRPKINALTLTIALFLGVFILTSITGINFERSFWSTFERMTGIWTMFHLFSFFIVLSSCFKERKDWERILAVSILAGVFLSLYILRGNEISTRGGGTIGNTSFMAAYLLFDIFFAIILFLATRGWWRLFFGISLAIMLPVLFNSSARGALASFWGGIFLLALGYMWFSRQKLLKRGTVAIILICLILGSFVLVWQPDFIENEVNTLLRGMNPRFTVWRLALESWLERPLLGWGPENFNIAFNRHFNPCMFLSECGKEIWFDRSHNIVFDTAVTTGLLGLLSYLSIFIVAVFGLLRVLPKITERRNIFFPLGMAVLLLVYFGQNLLVFDMINTYLVFFLSLGFISFLMYSQPEQEFKPKPLNPFLGSVIIIATIFALWFGNILPLKTGHYTVKMAAAQTPEDMISSFQKGLGSWMEKYELREHFAQRVVKLGYEAQPDNESARKAFELAESEMEISCEKNSLDFRPHLFLGRLYLSSYHFSGNKEKLVKSEETLLKAIELSPTNQQGYWHLAEVRLSQGRGEEAFALLQKAIDLEPRLNSSYWYSAMAYRIARNYEKAKEKIVEAEEWGYPYKNNIDDLQKVISIYLALNDDAALVPLYLRALELEPNNTQSWASLAASYANIGQFDKAREAAKKVGEINPELRPKMEEFLASLPQ